MIEIDELDKKILDLSGQLTDLQTEKEKVWFKNTLTKLPREKIEINYFDMETCNPIYRRRIVLRSEELIAILKEINGN